MRRIVSRTNRPFSFGNCPAASSTTANISQPYAPDYDIRCLPAKDCTIYQKQENPEDTPILSRVNKRFPL